MIFPLLMAPVVFALYCWAARDFEGPPIVKAAEQARLAREAIAAAAKPAEPPADYWVSLYR